MRMRAAFPDEWMSFLHDNFESQEHVAWVFGVEGSTARKWWNGEHSPAGWAVRLAFQIMPDAALAALARGAEIWASMSIERADHTGLSTAWVRAAVSSYCSSLGRASARARPAFFVGA